MQLLGLVQLAGLLGWISASMLAQGGGVATLLHKGMVHRPDRPEGATRNTHDRQRVADDGTSLVGNDVLVCGPPAQASLYSSP